MGRVNRVVARELKLGDEHVVVISVNVRAVLPRLLTPTEQEIALCILQGMSSQAIAEARETSVYTVNNQIAAIFRKVGVNSRSEFTGFVAAKCSSCCLEDCEACRQDCQVSR